MMKNEETAGKTILHEGEKAQCIHRVPSIPWVKSTYSRLNGYRNIVGSTFWEASAVSCALDDRAFDYFA